MKEKLEKLQEMIGYQFKDPGLLTHALTHSSYANEKHWDKTRCNERLEFQNMDFSVFFSTLMSPCRRAR